MHHIRSVNEPKSNRSYSVERILVLSPAASYFLLLSASAPSPLGNESSDEVKEKINELEKISKACVETMGEGVDAYWLMSKDLDHKVNDIDSRMTTLTNIVIEMAAEKKEILNIVQEQQATLIELSARFACIAHACTWKGKEEKEAEEETPDQEN